MLTELQSLLDRQFGGLIVAGKHRCGVGECCILELESARLGIPWTDEPIDVRCLDLRWINDIVVPSDVRTPAMLQLLAAYSGSLDWPDARLTAVADRIAVETIRQVVAALPGLSPTAVRLCREVIARDSVRSAVRGVVDDWPAGRLSDSLWSTLRNLASYCRRRDRVSDVGLVSVAGRIPLHASAEARADRRAIFDQAVAIWLDAARATGDPAAG